MFIFLPTFVYNQHWVYFVSKTNNKNFVSKMCVIFHFYIQSCFKSFISLLSPQSTGVLQKFLLSHKGSSDIDDSTGH